MEGSDEMLAEYQVKEHSKELTAFLELIQDSESLNSGDPVVDLKNMSIVISTINKESAYNQLCFLVIGLEFRAFEKHVLRPLKNYIKIFGKESIKEKATVCKNRKKAKKILTEARTQLNSILTEFKSNKYWYKS